MAVLRWLTLTILLLLIAITSLSCSKRDQPTGQTAPSTIVTSIPPFKTKEPEVYQALRSITFTPADGGQARVTTTTIVREGNNRREEDNSRETKGVYLDVLAGSFLLLPDEKIYAEIVGPTASSSVPEGLEEVYVHTAPIQSTYENLGSEILNGTTTTKYKVTVNSTNAGSVGENETLIWVDEALGMPVKTVTRSPAGTRTMELTQITLKVDKTQFEIPKDYRKVEMQLLQQRIR